MERIVSKCSGPAQERVREHDDKSESCQLQLNPVLGMQN